MGSVVSDVKITRNQHITVSLKSENLGSIRFDNETENYRTVTIEVKHGDTSTSNFLFLPLAKFEEFRLMLNRFNIELSKVQEIREMHPTQVAKAPALPIIVESNHPLTSTPTLAPAGFISHQ